MRSLINGPKSILVKVYDDVTKRSSATPENKYASGLLIGSDVKIRLYPYDASGDYPADFSATDAHEFAHAQRMAAGTNPWFRYFREMDGKKVENEYRYYSGLSQDSDYTTRYGVWQVPTIDPATGRFRYPPGYRWQSLFGHTWKLEEEN